MLLSIHLRDSTPIHPINKLLLHFTLLTLYTLGVVFSLTLLGKFETWTCMILLWPQYNVIRYCISMNKYICGIPQQRIQNSMKNSIQWELKNWQVTTEVYGWGDLSGVCTCFFSWWGMMCPSMPALIFWYLGWRRLRSAGWGVFWRRNFWE